jgi:hypothetical protein
MDRSSAPRQNPAMKGSALAFYVLSIGTVPVGNSTLRYAEVQADRIMRKAGVTAEWVDCAEARSDRSNDGVCQEKPDPKLFVIGIRGDNAPGSSSGSALGFAMSRSRSSKHAVVLYPRIIQVVHANADLLDEGTLLAHVIAHELAHLLFASTAHGEGIMRANWSRLEFEMMSEQTLLFTSRQVHLLQRTLQERWGGGGRGTPFLETTPTQSAWSLSFQDR